jgi:hypothetical protein
VVGIRHFDRNKCHLAYSKYVSISDEAFTVLTLENNWAMWNSMGTKDNWKELDVPSEWTTSKDRQKLQNNHDNLVDDSDDGDDNPQAMRYCGWTAKGIQRYNQIFHKVKAEREKLLHGEFESYCMEEFQGEGRGGSTGQESKQA